MSKMLYVINFILAQRCFVLKCGVKLNIHMSICLTVLSGVIAKGWKQTFFIPNQYTQSMNCVLYDTAIFAKTVA